MNPSKPPVMKFLTLLRKKQLFGRPVERRGPYKREVTISNNLGKKTTIELKIPFWLWRLQRNLMKGFRPKNLKQFTAMVLVGSLLSLGVVKGVTHIQRQNRALQEIAIKYEKGELKMKDVYEYGRMFGFSPQQVDKAVKVVRERADKP